MKPILFSGPMVRAILEGRKTQTRRVIKPQPKWSYAGLPIKTDDADPKGIIKLPYSVGDVLWVRETWAAPHKWDGESPRVITPDTRISYRATREGPCGLIWRPSIFMPRWAASLFLEVTAVKVERVQDISEEDAEAEGIRVECGPLSSCGHCNIAEFKKLWDSINAKRGYGWEVNPWVAAYTFKVEEVKR